MTLVFELGSPGGSPPGTNPTLSATLARRSELTCFPASEATAVLVLIPLPETVSVPGPFSGQQDRSRDLPPCLVRATA
jgi:hypothetical protein